jgi:uncharacterized membrane protein
MSRFVVVVFPSETRAYQGARAVKELHREGSLTLYSLAVLVKDAQGKLAIKDADDRGPLGGGVGALAGGLAGVVTGPVGMLAGSLGGALIGSLFDVANLGVGADFLEKVSSELSSGKSAVVAEIVEGWTTSLDARMEALGGVVLRTWRGDFEDAQFANEIDAENAEWAQLRAEYAQANAETKAKIKAKLDEAKAKLDATTRKADAKVETLNQELKARVGAMEQQVANAKAGAKEKLDQRIAKLRADYRVRTEKLRLAGAMAKEALAA